MITKKKKVLFISHEATRTGAPMLLLNLVRWLKQNYDTSFELHVLFNKNGELVKEFDNIAITYFATHHYYYKIAPVNKLIETIKTYKTVHAINKTQWDIVFTNTIVNGKILEKFNFNSAFIIAYVHELKYSIDKKMQTGDVQGTLQKAHYFLCGSTLVQKTLIESFNIEQNKTAIIYSFQDIKNNQKDFNISKNLKAEHNIPENALVVGMVGSFNWRKGVDLFIETALKMQAKNIYFVWVGASNKEQLIDQFNYDLKQKKQSANLIFIPPCKDYLKFYNLFDVFFLSSREDPYPMVVVEASSFGIPIICFENTGGAAEFIDDITGFVVPYADTQAVANHLETYNTQKALCVKNEEAIKHKSIASHSIDVNAKKIVELFYIKTTVDNIKQ